MSGLFAGTPLERPVTCEHCNKQLDACTCPRDASGNLALPKDIHPRIRREKRRGKWNTVITDLSPTTDGGPTDLKALLKHLRTTLSTGGGIDTTGEQHALVLQGDHRDAVVAKLNAMGYSAKPAGG